MKRVFPVIGVGLIAVFVGVVLHLGTVFPRSHTSVLNLEGQTNIVVLTFTDLRMDHWSSDYVGELVQLGVVEGYEDGTFRPAQEITRAELTKMTLVALGIEIPEKEAVEDMPFGDVVPDDWFVGHIHQARELGIIEGYEDHTFKPFQSVNRAEALKIILETAGLDLGEYESDFDDVSAGSWMDPYIGFGQTTGVVEGYEDGTFRPANPINRAEASKIIIEVLELFEAIEEDVTVGEEEEEEEESGGGSGTSDGSTEDMSSNGEEEEEEEDTVDLCNGISCPDLCEDDTFKSNGTCVDGVCNYSAQGCDYGCNAAGDSCYAYSCEWDWYQNVLDGDTDELLWGCTEDRAYCHPGDPECCDYDLDTGEYSDCVDCREEGNCVEPACVGVDCGNYCDGDTLYFDAMGCVDGVCEGFQTEVCAAGCSYGQCNDESCVDVECPDSCSGNDRYFDGACLEGVGSCNYDVENCVYGCDEGACLEACDGVECPDYCDGPTLFSNGNCVVAGEGLAPICGYEETLCEFGCAEGACNPDPCEGVSCPDTCDDDGVTRLLEGECVDGACHYTHDECSTFCTEGEMWGDVYGMCYYAGACVDDEFGPGCDYETLYCDDGCTGDICTGTEACDYVTCDDFCEFGVSYTNGTCIGGDCHYATSEECYNGCDEETGLCAYMDFPVGTIFVTNEDVPGNIDGNMGGIAGGSFICQQSAGNTHFLGGWMPILGDSITDANALMPVSSYFNLNLEIVSEVWQDLFDPLTPLQASLNFMNSYDVNGDWEEAPEGTYVWTGSDTEGMIGLHHCGDWMLTDDLHFGNVGIVSETENGQWLYSGDSNFCDGTAKLYCVRGW